MVASIIKSGGEQRLALRKPQVGRKDEASYDSHDNEDDETNTIIWWCNLLLHFPAKLYHRRNYVNCDCGKFQTVFPH